MKSIYLQRIEEAYKQFELFTVRGQVKNGDYLLLFRNAQKNYDISQFITNDGRFADDIFDRWCESAKFFKSVDENRYIVIMLLKQNDTYQLINDYRI